jgi:hypothetical protein
LPAEWATGKRNRSSNGCLKENRRDKPKKLGMMASGRRETAEPGRFNAA